MTTQTHQSGTTFRVVVAVVPLVVALVVPLSGSKWNQGLK